MQFKVQKKENSNRHKYKKTDLDFAYDFSKQILKDCEGLIKSIVLFGSSARRQENAHDIDILLILDDLTIHLTPEIIQAYNIIVENRVKEINKKIHITTLRLTNFWDFVRSSDPVAINILRDGVAIIDPGFFEPLQALLFQGKIRPSWEAIYAYYNKAPETLNNSKQLIMQATLDLYWAVLDAAHAALMKLGQIPPSPSHVSTMIQKHIIDKKLSHPRYVKTMNEFYKLSKMIMLREISHITGNQYDVYYAQAEDFVREMKRILDKK